MARDLKNWIVNDNDSRDTAKYKPEEWTRVVPGPARISSILVSNVAEYVEPEDPDAPCVGTVVEFRIANAYGETLVMIEPGALIRNHRSDRFTLPSIYIERGQFLEFRADSPDMHVIVSGAGR